MNSVYVIGSNLDNITQVQATLLETGLFENVEYCTSLSEYRRRIKSDSGLKIVLLFEDFDGIAWIEFAKEIRREDSLSPIVLIADNRSEIELDEAMTAGLAEILPLTPSLEEYIAKLGPISDRLTALSRRLATEVSQIDSVGQVQVFFGAKGGVGTSLHALLFARFWAKHVRTCIVDLDLRKGDLTAYSASHPRRNIADLAEISRELSGRSIAEVAHSLECGIDLIAAPGETERVDALDESDVRLIISALRVAYDLVVIDCGSHISDITAVAIEAADEVTIVTTPELVAIRNTRDAVKTFDRFALTIGAPPRLLFNRASKKAEIQPALGAKMTGLNQVSVIDESTGIDSYMNMSTILEAKTPSWDEIYKNMWDKGVAPAQTEVKASQPLKRILAGRHSRKKNKVTSNQEAGQATIEGTAGIVVLLGLALISLQLLLWGVSHILAYSAAEEGARLVSRGASSAHVLDQVKDFVPTFWDSDPSIDTNELDKSFTVSVATPGPIDSLFGKEVSYTVHYLAEDAS